MVAAEVEAVYYELELGARETAQGIKAPVAKSDELDPHSGRKEPMFANYSLTSTCVACHMCT